MLSIFAYLDPGTGSIIFQSAVGVIAGVGLFGRRFFYSAGHKVKTLFSKPETNDRAEEK